MPFKLTCKVIDGVDLFPTAAPEAQATQGPNSAAGFLIHSLRNLQIAYRGVPFVYQEVDLLSVSSTGVTGLGKNFCGCR